jgi:hypothetical protein
MEEMSDKVTHTKSPLLKMRQSPTQKKRRRLEFSANEKKGKEIHSLSLDFHHVSNSFLLNSSIRVKMKKYTKRSERMTVRTQKRLLVLGVDYTQTSK